MQRAKQAFKALRESIGYPAHDLHASTKNFLDLNIEKIAKEMRLEELGKERGEADHPASDALGHDDTELAIIHRVEKAATDDFSLYQDQQQTYHERSHRLNVLDHAGTIRSAAREALGDFSTEVHQGKDELYRLKNEVLHRRRDLDQFKNEHGLTRSAHYPESKILSLGIISILLVLEAVLNGNFLSVGNELGILGGIVTAFAIAVINVGLGVVVGIVFFRWLNHRSLLRRTIGATGTLAYLIIIVAFNLAVAHYRDALLGPMPEQADQIAMQAILSRPLGINSVESLFLLILGVSFSLIAAFDGLHMNDVYPGYGKLDRRLQDAREDYRAKKEDLLSYLNESRKEGVAAMKAAQKNLDKRLSEYKAVVKGSHRLEATMRAHLEQLERGCQHLMSIYRRANTIARSRRPPVHFSENYRLKPRELASARISADLVETSRLEEEVSQASRVLEKSIQEVQDAFDGAVNEYHQLEHIEKEGEQ